MSPSLSQRLAPLWASVALLALTPPSQAIEVVTATLTGETTLEIKTGSVDYDVVVRGTDGEENTPYQYIVYVVGTDIYGNDVYLDAGDKGIFTVSGQRTVANPNGDGIVIEPPTTFTIKGTWVVPDDGTLHGSAYRLAVAIYRDPPGLPVDVADLDVERAIWLQSGNLTIDVLPDLAVGSPGSTYQAGRYRGADIVQFNNTWYNKSPADGGRESRPLTGSDGYVADHRLTTNPEFGDANNDDFLLSRYRFAGDVAVVPGGASIVRKVVVTDTPGAVPAYGLTDLSGLPILGTDRCYTPQPDDGFLDIGEKVTVVLEQLVPENYSGAYFVALRMAMSAADEDASEENNTFVSNEKNKFEILETDSPTTEPSSVISTDNGTFVRGGSAASDYSSVSENGDLVAFASRSQDLLVPPSMAEIYTDSLGQGGNMADPATYPVSNRSGALEFATVEPYLTSGQQIFVKYRQTREVLLASRTAGGSSANADCFNPAISANGRYVAFDSTATDILPKEPTGSRSMIYVFDIERLQTVIISRDSSGALADGDCFNPQISQSGRFVVFESMARNLDPDRPIPDTNLNQQIYLHDRDSDRDGTFDEEGETKTYLVSVNNAGEVADGLCANPVVNLEDTSAEIVDNDGMFVAFTSYARNMPEGTGFAMVYRVTVDPATGADDGSVIPVSVNDLGAPPEAVGVDPVGAYIVPFADEAAINGDGSQIAFTSAANNFVYNTGDGTYVPTFPNNDPGNPGAPVDPAVVPGGDYNRVPDVFVRDIPASKTVRISQSLPRVATGTITFLSSSADCNIPEGQPSAGESITINDGASSVTLTFDVDVPIGATVFETRDNLVGAINASGLNIVAYASNPPNAEDPGTGYIPSIFLRNSFPSPGEAANVPIETDSPALAVTGMSGAGTQADENVADSQGVPFGSVQPSIDRSGRFVAFRSNAYNLDVHVSTDENIQPSLPPLPTGLPLVATGEPIRPLIFPTSNIYLHDRQIDPAKDPDEPANTSTERVSLSKFGYKTWIDGGQQSGVGADYSANNSRPAISADGRFVSFSSDARGEGGLIFGPNNLTPLDTQNVRDVFIHDRRTVGENPPAPSTRPDVEMRSPSGGIARIAAGTTLPLAARVLPKAGKSIASVQFFVNGVAVGSPLVAEPYSTTYKFSNPGDYTIAVVVTDSSGITNSEVRRLTVGSPVGVAPTIALVQPSSQVSNFVALSDLLFNAVVQDDNIDKVSFWFIGEELEAREGDGGVWYPDLDTGGARIFRPTATGDFTLIATATDKDGNTSVTDISALNIASVGASFPKVRLEQAAPGVPVVAGGAYQLRASLADPIPGLSFDEANSGVLFYGNNVYLGLGLLQSDGTYLLDWNVPEEPRDYEISAFFVAPNRLISTDPEQYANSVTKAENPKGGPIILKAQDSVDLDVSLTKPVADVTTVAPGVPVLLEARAEVPNIDDPEDNGQGTIESVRFYQNGILITFIDPVTNLETGDINAFPYQIPFTPPSAGQYTITAVAYSTAGIITRSASKLINAVSGTPPTVEILSPSDGLVTPQTAINVLWEASDADGSVQTINVLVNGRTEETFSATDGAVGSGSFTLFPPSQGTYEFVVRATDNLGNVTDSDPVTVTIDNSIGQPPIITMIHPTPGGGQDTVNDFSTPSQFFFNAIVTLPAGVSVAPGGVRFFANGVPVEGTVSNIDNTYSVFWQPNNDGDYNITAQVTDSRGFLGVSPALFFRIDPPVRPLPSVRLLPLASPAVTAGSRVFLQAETDGGLTAVDRVDFYANGVYIGAKSVNTAALTTTLFEWTPPPGAGFYVLTARAIQVLAEPGDNSVISEGVSLSVTPVLGNAPVVFLSPETITERNYVTGSQLFLNATAAAFNGAIIPSNGVAFSYNNGQSTNAATNSGIQIGDQYVYAAQIGLAAGNLYATAQDSLGAVGYSDVVQLRSSSPSRSYPTITVLTNHWVGLQQPLSAGEPVELRAEASFPAVSATNADSRVEFYANGAYLGVGAATNTNRPSEYSYVWITPSVAGTFDIKARAVALDRTDSSSTTSVDAGGNTNTTTTETPWYSSVISYTSAVVEVDAIPGNLEPGSNGEFVLEIYQKLLYRDPTYQEWIDGTQLLDAGIFDRATLVMNLMGFSTRQRLFSRVNEYGRTSMTAMLPFYRLGIAPNVNQVLRFLSLLESDDTLLPIQGVYSGIPDAPWGATIGLAAAIQEELFRSQQFRFKYPTVTSMANTTFNDWLRDTMFARVSGGDEDQIVNMMNTIAAQAIRQGAATAFRSELAWVALEAGYITAPEQSVQLQAATTILNFQLNGKWDAAYGKKNPYSLKAVQNILFAAGMAGNVGGSNIPRYSGSSKSYQGLLFSGGITSKTTFGSADVSQISGDIRVKTSARGGYSATLSLENGTRIRAKGMLQTDGSIKDEWPGGMDVDLTPVEDGDAKYLEGSVMGPEAPVRVRVLAGQLIYSKADPFGSPGNYTLSLRLEPHPAKLDPLQGSGYATVKIGSTGVAKIKGVLADKTRFTASAPVWGATGEPGEEALLLHRILAKGNGSIAGQIVRRNGGSGEGNLSWATVASAYGLPRQLVLNATMSPYQGVLPWTGSILPANWTWNTPFSLQWKGGDESGAVNFTVPGNFFGSAAELSLKVRTKSGLVRGSFTDTATGSKYKIYGVLDQAVGAVDGFFLTPQSSGRIEINR